jgi:hypothetical protein
MEKQKTPCEIIYVKEKSGTGWKWRAISASGAVRNSESVYGLFYECVADARTKGYSPEGVLPPDYVRRGLRSN